MISIVNYIRSIFCKHDWELIYDCFIKVDKESKLMIYRQRVYRCTKCCYYKKIKLN